MADPTETNSQDAPQQEVRKKRGVRQDIINVLAQRVLKKATEKVEKPAQQICDKLPSTPEEIRGLPFYNVTFEAIRYQRDNYLVSTFYANRRSRQRKRGLPAPPVAQIPYHPAALGSTQIRHLASWFVPSPTVRDALLPIVVTLPGGPLRDIITDAVADAIPLAQPQVDNAVKGSLMNVVNDPHWRQVIKNRAGGYMGSRDAVRGTEPPI